MSEAERVIGVMREHRLAGGGGIYGAAEVEAVLGEIDRLRARVEAAERERDEARKEVRGCAT